MGKRRNPQRLLSFDEFRSRYFKLGEAPYSTQEEFYSDYRASGLDYADYRELTTSAEPTNFYELGWEDAKARKSRNNYIRERKDKAEYDAGYEAWLDRYEKIKKKQKRKSRY